ncbi:MAG: DNA polymerase II [Pseudomonadota bacterium]
MDDTRRGFLLSRHWRDTPDGIELSYWLRCEDGPLRLRVPGQRSLFFLRRDSLPAAESVLASSAVAEVRELALNDFQHAPVVGVYFSAQRAARQCAERLREAGLDPLEADINPADRYLMERFITGGVRAQPGAMPQLAPDDYRPRLRLLSVDIETAMEGLQLYSIGVHGVDHGAESDMQVRRVFMVGEGADQDFVVSYPSQRAALEAFLDWLQDYDPDVLIGWNVINFDLWYLQRLADKLEFRLALGREREAANWIQLDDEGERRRVVLPGRVVLDGIELLRAAFYRFESFSLENVSRVLLGEGKLLKGAGRGDEITRLFIEDKTRLAEYNLRDCELVSEIFETASLAEFAIARAAMTGLAMDRMGGAVATFDNLYLPRLHRAAYVAPNASREQIASPGGFVLDSKPGLYDHVLVLDFKSLYPSIIRTFCIDPLGLARGTAGELATADTVDGYLEARFAREGHILPELITRLWQQRDAAKAAHDAPLSQAIKIIMNSFYGVLGSPGCRFFDARLASSITRRGHEILGRTRDKIEALGYAVIYGDTDSVFVWVRQATDTSEARAAGEHLQRELNRWWSQVIAEEHGLDSRLELEFETHFRRFLMPTVRGSDKGSKKRYAGLATEGEREELVFKGLENVRTDWTSLARSFQEELYRRIFYQEPYESYIRETVAALRNGQHDPELVYRKRLRRRLDDYERNVPPHVQAARRYAERGLEAPRRGAWVEYVITSGGAEPAAAPQAQLDYQHYVDRQLAPVADGILNLLDQSFSGIVDQQIALF